MYCRFIQVLEDYLLKWKPETNMNVHRASISFEMHACEAMLATMKSLIQAGMLMHNTFV